MREAVDLRLVSEVPLGAFLSGGVDSSTVVALMAELSTDPVNTCSIAFGEAEFNEAEYAAMTLPQYYKSVEEFRAPLADTDSAVSNAGLRIEHCETRVVPCPFAADFGHHGDAARFAAAYVPTLRSWSAATFRSGLSTGRSEAERDQIIDDFYGTYETMVREAPDGHAMDYVHVYLTIAKAD